MKIELNKRVLSEEIDPDVEKKLLPMKMQLFITML